MLALAIDLAGAPNAGARLPRQYKSRRTLDCHRDTSIRDPASLSGRVVSAIGSIRILEGGITMKRLTPLLIAVATLAGVVAFTARAPRHAAAQQAAPIFVTGIPSGYRDWRLISVAHEEGDLHSFAAVLGNDVAIKAYREGKLLFPDGTIIAALHYRHVPSEENNKVFGRDQSFVAGSPTNIQFMVKDSKKYAATGGWGFGHFQDGKPSTDEAMMKTCFACHQQMKARDLVFTRYAP
jgi:Cytochrome P460